MQCPHCSKTQVGFCPNCDKHYFQVGVTIHNDSAVSALKERKELTERKDTEIKMLKKKLGWSRLYLVIAMAVAILCFGLSRRPGQEPPPPERRKININRPIAFNSEYLLRPEGSVVGDFPLDVRRRVIINVLVECQDCDDEFLTIFLLDEDNYRMLDLGQAYIRIDEVYGKSYSFNSSLNKGRYFVVIQNLSEQDMAIKVKASMSYTQDYLAPQNEASLDPSL